MKNLVKVDNKYYFVEPQGTARWLLGINGNETFDYMECLTKEKTNKILSSVSQDDYHLTDSILNCEHETTEQRNAVPATLTSAGYTGDTYCTICERPITKGEEIPKQEFELTIASSYYPYTGKAIEPDVTVTLDESTLQEGTDYTVSYENNVNAGTASITVTGINGYEGGETTKTFTITPVSVEDDMITLDKDSYEYTGSAIIPGITVTDHNENTLSETADYTVSITDNTNVGTATITVTGTGNYTGTATKTFAISKKAINDSDITLDSASYEYTGSVITPDVTVKVNGKTLTKDTDYTVSYENNKNIGTETATVTVTGCNNYSGTVTKKFSITRKQASNLTVTLNKESYEYTGSAITPSVSVTDKEGKDLVENTDYTVSYSNNTTPGTATITITGAGIYEGSATKTFTITAKDIGTMDMQYEASHTYTGSAICPAVTIKGLVKDTDYTVSYDNNVNAGTASIVVTGIGNYTGELKGFFTIEAADLSEKIVTVSGEPFTYTGTEICPEVSIEGISADDYTVTYSDNINAGTAKVTITGTGNYQGTATETFVINAKDINDANITIQFADNIDTFEETGNAIEPEVQVTGINKNDYTISYKDNTEIGTGAVIISGQGNYTGSIEKPFHIVEKITDISSGFTLMIPKKTYEYTGTEITPEVTVTDSDGNVLEKEVDYTVEYSNNTKVGTASIIITGKNLYKGMLKGTFSITQADISKKQVTLSEDSFTYTGEEWKPEVTIEGLEEGVDYTVVYYNNVHTTDTYTKETAFARVIGNGNCKNTQDVPFTIHPKDLTADDIESFGLMSYTGKEIKPNVSFRDAICEITSTSYKNNINAGTGEVTVTCTGDLEGTATKKFTITPAKLENKENLASITDNGYEHSGTTYYYTGSEIKPELVIIGLTENKDYTVTYQNNKNVGTASIVATGMGNYSGTFTKTFTIAKKPEENTGSSNTGNQNGGSQSGNSQSGNSQTGNVSSGTTGKTPTSSTATSNAGTGNITTGNAGSNSTGTGSVTSIKISGISNNIAAGKKIKLTAATTSGTVPVTWSSSNTKVATVSKSGIVTLNKKSAGKTVTITATYANGARSTFKIKAMKGVVKKVTVSGAKTVKAGKSLKLKARITATSGANKKITWTSSNTKYAKVSSSGKVVTSKAAKGKKVKITAMATDGSGKKQTVTIKIK